MATSDMLTRFNAAYRQGHDNSALQTSVRAWLCMSHLRCADGHDRSQRRQHLVAGQQNLHDVQVACSHKAGGHQQHISPQGGSGQGQG